MLPYGAALLLAGAAAGGGGGGGGSTTIRSSRVAYVNNSNSIAFSLPAGSLAGDTCMIMAEHGWAVTVPSGWTTIDNSAGSNANGAAFRKTLTSGDITAGSVTISFGGTYYGLVFGLTFVGAITGIRNATFDRTGGGATSRTITTNAATPVIGDLAIYFAFGRVNAAVSSSVGATLQSGANVEASGILASQTLTVGGFISATFTYGATNGGDYFGIIVISP